MLMIQQRCESWPTGPVGLARRARYTCTAGAGVSDSDTNTGVSVIDINTNVNTIDSVIHTRFSVNNSAITNITNNIMVLKIMEFGNHGS